MLEGVAEAGAWSSVLTLITNEYKVEYIIPSFLIRIKCHESNDIFRLHKSFFGDKRIILFLFGIIGHENLRIFNYV